MYLVKKRRDSLISADATEEQVICDRAQHLPWAEETRAEVPKRESQVTECIT
jgi:hypothetical protein